jgi:hypothetical protein
MAHFPLTNVKTILDKYDISSDFNSVVIARLRNELDNTTFGTSGFKARMNGLGDGVFSLAGLMDIASGGQDEIINSKMALTDVPILVTLNGAVDFDRCKFGVIQQGEYQCGGNVGGRAEFSVNGRISSNVLTDGNIMAVGAKTGTFNGTARQLGAVTASQRIYAAIHATAKSAFTSAVFKLQSDDNSGFSSPTDRITFTTITDLTSQFTSLAGAITDDYWRIICSSFTGTSLTVYTAVGIL